MVKHCIAFYRSLDLTITSYIIICVYINLYLSTFIKIIESVCDTNYLILSTVLLFIIPNSLFAQSYGNFEFYTYVLAHVFFIYLKFYNKSIT